VEQAGSGAVHGSSFWNKVLNYMPARPRGLAGSSPWGRAFRPVMHFNADLCRLCRLPPFTDVYALSGRF